MRSLVLALLFVGCAAKRDWVDDVRFVHGAPAHGVPGPWALSGYRIGAHALKTLGLGRGEAFSLQIVHRSPPSIQYTCMMDGMMAATGVSPGKMNIRHETVAREEELETIVTYKGRTLRYTLVDAFRARIKQIDYAEFPEGAELMRALPDDQILVQR